MRDRSGRELDTAILDIDGTLVDSVYEHTVAWSRAFQDVGVSVPGHTLHAAIGMGAERLVAYVAGDAVERAMGDRVRTIHDAEFGRLGARVRLLPGADRVIGELKRRGLAVAVATSGNERDTQRALEEVPDSALLDAVVTGSDAEQGKPAPDLLDVALTRVRGRRAMVVGDSPWDARAGRERDLLVVAVLTGGFGASELTAAGADLVCSSLGELIERMGTTAWASADLGGGGRSALV